MEVLLCCFCRAYAGTINRQQITTLFHILPQPPGILARRETLRCIPCHDNQNRFFLVRCFCQLVRCTKFRNHPGIIPPPGRRERQRQYSEFFFMPQKKNHCPFFTKKTDTGMVVCAETITLNPDLNSVVTRLVRFHFQRYCFAHTPAQHNLFHTGTALIAGETRLPAVTIDANISLAVRCVLQNQANSIRVPGQDSFPWHSDGGHGHIGLVPRQRS